MKIDVTEQENRLIQKLRDKDNFNYEAEFEVDIGKAVEESIKEMKLKETSPEQYLNIMTELQRIRSHSQDTRESNHKLFEAIVIILKELKDGVTIIKKHFVKYILIGFLVGLVGGTGFGMAYPLWKPYGKEVVDLGKKILRVGGNE